MSPFSVQIQEDDPFTDLEELSMSYGEEPLVTWRGWNIINYYTRAKTVEKRLSAVGMHGVWPPMEEMVAICSNNENHEAPWQTCGCGTWSFRNRNNLIQALGSYQSLHHLVIGEVYIWGRILECDNGYRAQKAYPKSLQFCENHTLNEDEIKLMAKLYGVPWKRYEFKQPPCLAHDIAFSSLIGSPDVQVTVTYNCGLTTHGQFSGNKIQDIIDNPAKISKLFPHHH